MDESHEPSMHDIDYAISLWGYTATVRRIAYLLRESAPHLRAISDWHGAPSDAHAEAARCDMVAGILEAAVAAMENIWPHERLAEKGGQHG